MVYGGSILMVSGLLAAACSLDSSGVDPDTGATTIGAGGSPTTTSTGSASGSTTTGTGGAGGAGGGAGGSGGVGGIPGTGGSGGVGGIPGTGGSGGVGGIPGTGGAGGVGGGQGGAGGGIVCEPAGEPMLNGMQPLVLKGDTSLATETNDTHAYGCMGYGAISNDVIYEITPTVSGMVTAELVSPLYAGLVYARSDCGIKATEYDCDDTAGLATITFMVTAMEPFFIVVDGAGEEGAFTLTVNLLAP